MRFIFLARGYRFMAPVLGFFEVLIWVLAIRQVMLNLSNIVCLLAYCSGFAMGNYIGIRVEEKLSIGMVLLRIVAYNQIEALTEFMKSNNYGYTLVDGEGNQRKVKIIFSILKRKDLHDVLQAISRYAPQSFYTIENVKTVSEGIFPLPEPSALSKLFRKNRKSR